MTRYHGAEWDPLGTQTQPQMSRHDIVCLHTMAGSLDGTRAFFKNQGYTGTESHFGLGGSGKAYQWQDLDFTADANFEGNHRVISIETADRGETFPNWVGSDVPAWTREQVEWIVDFCVWACKHYDIPARVIDNTLPSARGLAYHRQGIDGNFGPPYPGRQGIGERWSTSGGKVCPGDRRIKQLVEVIAPLVKAEVEGPKDYDYIVTARKILKRRRKRFERARRGLAAYVNDLVQDGWRVRVIRVRDKR